MIEEVKRTPRQQYIRFFVFALLGIISAFSFRVGFERLARSPKENMYLKCNQELRDDFLKVNQDLEKKESQLAVMKNRDDKLYRAFFGMDPLSSTVREAGTGGAFRYQSLLTISDPDGIIDAFNKVDKLSSKVQIQYTSFSDLYRKAVDKENLIACKPSIQPISPADQYWLTSPFGFRRDPFTGKRTGHHGIDLAGPKGLKIYATGDGVVALTEVSKRGYGNEVLISHGFGYSTRYAHLQKIFVKKGEKVKRGQVIGLLGSTGRSTGPHLHYEVRLDNIPLNPFHYFYEDLTPEEFREIATNAGK